MYPSDVGPVGQWRKERIFKTEKFHIFHTIYTETCTFSILLPLSLSPIYCKYSQNTFDHIHDLG